MSRSISEILETMLSVARENFPQLSWVPNSPEVDILVPTLYGFRDCYVLVDYVKLLTNLNGYIKLSTDKSLRSMLMEVLNIDEVQLDTLLREDLDNFAETYWLGTRKGGVKAKGPVLLTFMNDNPVTIPKGTKFVSVLRKKEYVTIESVNNRVPVNENGVFVLRVFVECTEVGSDGNIIAGAVLVPEQKINNLIKCEVACNITNGEDIESNIDFVNRIKVGRISKGVGSRSYLRSLILSDPRVYDVYISTKGSNDFYRPLGVDVWVYAQETPRPVTEVVKVSNNYVLEQQPLIDENPILTSGYILNIVDNSYARSVEAVDSVSGPADQAITYYVDDTIRSLQMKVEDLDNWLLGGRRLVLIKKAKRVKINLSVKLYCSFGYIVDEVRESVRDNLLCFFVGGTTTYGEKFKRKLLGATIDKSDVLRVIVNTEGVDRVDLSSFEVKREDSSESPDSIVLEKNEYACLGSINWL